MSTVREDTRRDIESVLQEERSFPPPRAFAARARVTAKALSQMRRRAAADPQGFWADLARRELVWHKPFSITLDESQAPNFRWFSDGELNVATNCLDVHLAERGARAGIVRGAARSAEAHLT